MENLQECVLCATLVISEESTLTKPTLNNNLTVYFLVKKMLNISDLTFLHLLKCWGDPCNWISCCWKCSKTVLEAQQLFVEMKKLEGQLNQLRKTMEKNIYKCTQKPSKVTRGNPSNKASSIQMIREETVERLKLSTGSEQNELNAFEDEIKMEIEDDTSGNVSDEVENTSNGLDNDDESEESDKDDDTEDKDTVKYETKSGQQSKSNSSRLIKASIRNRKPKSTGFGVDNVKVVEAKNKRRSRSGRVIKSFKAGYNSDSSESSDALLQGKQENSSDRDYSPPPSPVTQGETNNINEDENSKKSKNTFHCTECPKKYSCQYNVNRHRKQVHGLKSKSANNQNGEKLDGDQPLFLQENASGRDHSSPSSHVMQRDTNEDKLNEDGSLKKNENTFHCPECPNIYRCQYNVIRHREQVHGHKDLRKLKSRFSCELCTRKFATKYRLGLHIRSHEKYRLKCPECGEVQKSKGHLLKHIEIVHQKKRYGECSRVPAVSECICEKCGKAFSRKTDLTKHVMKVHEGLRNLKSISCELCTRKFATKYKLGLHLPTHDKDRCKCPECGKQLRSKSSLRDHIEIVHQKKRNFICEICNASFTQRSYLRYHKMKEHDIELKDSNVKLKCDECGKVFSEPSSLRDHINNIHRRIFKFRCPVCNTGKGSASALKKHLNSAHTNDRPEVCEVCQKSFSTKMYLKYHMRGHTGEKPYQCKFCSKGFTNSKSKRRHEQSIHSEQNNYQCELCGKSYPSKDYLTSHRWYSHNNKKSTLPPKNIIPTEEVEKIVREEILKEKPPVADVVVGDEDVDNSLEGGGITNIIP